MYPLIVKSHVGLAKECVTCNNWRIDNQYSCSCPGWVGGPSLVVSCHVSWNNIEIHRYKPVVNTLYIVI